MDRVAVETCQRGDLDGGQIGRHVPQEPAERSL
jgi:hypothetical protein